MTTQLMTRDDQGRLISKPGTLSRQVYDLMLQDKTRSEIAEALDRKRNLIGVIMWQIRHPKRAKQAAFDRQQARVA